MEYVPIFPREMNHAKWCKIGDRENGSIIKFVFVRADLKTTIYEECYFVCLFLLSLMLRKQIFFPHTQSTESGNMSNILDKYLQKA